MVKKKKSSYVKSVLLLFWSAKNCGHLGPYNKKLSCLCLICINKLYVSIYNIHVYIICCVYINCLSKYFEYVFFCENVAGPVKLKKLLFVSVYPKSMYIRPQSIVRLNFKNKVIAMLLPHDSVLNKMNGCLCL